MKLHAHTSLRRRHSQRGSVVLVLLAFLVIMLMLCMATSRSVNISRKEIALIEKHQIARLAATTNAPPTSIKTPGAP